MRSTLHEAMLTVLSEFGGAMRCDDLAQEIADRDLYRRRDGQHAPSHQVRARAVRYPALFTSSDDGSGRISLREDARTTLSGLAVFCADVGSVANGRFGWARSEARDRTAELHDTSRPSALVEAVCGELAAGRPVALGFECPLFVPVPIDERALGRARVGEGNRPWSAGAGTGAMATGFVQAAWVLDAIRSRHPEQHLWIDWDAFASAGQGLLVWEAFVAAAAKGTSHVDDAAIAVKAFVDALPNLRAASSVSAERPLSLIGAAALWSGWAAGDDDLLHASPIVLRAT